ncbi:hypothetical protein Tco_1034354 [Tanacetum coccineum]
MPKFLAIEILSSEVVVGRSLSSSEADSDGGVISLTISLPLYLVGDIVKSVSTAVHFGIAGVSSVVAYLPVASIGGRSLNPAAMMLLCI